MGIPSQACRQATELHLRSQQQSSLQLRGNVAKTAKEMAHGIVDGGETGTVTVTDVEIETEIGTDRTKPRKRSHRSQQLQRHSQAHQPSELLLLQAMLHRQRPLRQRQVLQARMSPDERWRMV